MVHLGGIAFFGFDDDSAIHARGNVLQDHGRTAVVHKDAGVIDGEFKLDRLAWRNGAVLVLRRHHGGMEVHGMHHGRHHHRHGGQGFIAAVGHAEVDFVAHPRPYRRAGHLVAKSPGTELHAGCDFNQFMAGI